MRTPEREISRTGAELVRPESGKWISAGDLSAPLVVFVHGFTAHGRYLKQIACYIEDNGLIAALFNYDSYAGIDRAANDLEFLLDGLNQRLASHGYALVGHSMGGLVIRYFAQYSQAPCRNALRGIATLGSPHQGALSRRILYSLLDWGDAVSAPNPFARSVVCPAARQLTDITADGIISQLNIHAKTNPLTVPILSFSGGLPFLEFGLGEGGFTGTLRNFILQRLIGEKPNDGLVAESSSNMSQVVGAPANINHCRNYPAYPATNHTYLSKNQQIGRLLHDWLMQLFTSVSRC